MQVEDCVASAAAKDGATGSGIMACAAKPGTPAPPAQSPSRSLVYVVDLAPGRCDKGQYVDVDASVSLAELRGFGSSIGKSLVGKSMSSKIGLNTISTSVSCQVIGPADGKEGESPSVSVIVSGPASGVQGPDGSFGFADRGPGDADAVVWTRKVPLHFASPTAEDLQLSATVYDENLQPAGDCSLAVQQADIPYPPPTCSVSIAAYGNQCVLVSQTNHGKVSGANPPSPWNCGLLPVTKYTYSGSVSGPGGSAICTSSFTTVDFAPDATPPVMAPLAQISQAVDNALPPKPVEPVTTVLRTRFGRDPAGQCYRVEVLREQIGPSVRQYERTEPIPCTSH